MAKVTIKMPKIPKSLGACVDLYYDKRQERLAANQVVEAMKANETVIANHIIDSVPKGDAGAVGKRFKGIVKTELQYTAEEWDKLYAYIRKEGAFDILNRALNQEALRLRTDDLNLKIDKENERIAAANAKLPAKSKDRKPLKPRKMLPGVGTFNVVKLSVTKL